MALDDLQGIIRKLQDMIEAHRDYLSRHETRTRQVLIDPLLRELGWDVSDPKAVQLEYAVKLEYRAGTKWADYTLMFKDESTSDDEPKPVAVIEAKSLGSDLEDDKMMQALNYANRDGIDYMIVTDGDKWEMYEVFKRAPLEERVLMKFCLSQQPAHHSALQALGMWKPNLAADGGPSKAAESVFVSLESTSDLPTNQLNESPEQQRSDSASEDSDNWCSFEAELYPQDNKPIRLKIGNDIDEPVDHWLDVIQKVAAWLVDKGILSGSDCPIGGRMYTFIGQKAVHPDGSTPFRDSRSLPQGLVLERRYLNSREQWRKLSRFLKQPEKQSEIDASTIRVSYKSM